MSTGWLTKVAVADIDIAAYATASDRIGSHDPGELTYLEDVHRYEYWDGTTWQQLATGGGGGSVIENVNTVAVSGAAQTIPDVTVATINQITLTAACTLTFPAAAAGKSFVLALKQDGTGSRSVTWPTSATLLWPAATAPTLTTAVAKTDLFSFVCADGVHWLGLVGAQNF